MPFKVTDNIKKFVVANAEGMDRALGSMAIAIELLSKAQVPHRHGQLEASGYLRRNGLMSHTVGYTKEYALYQELGEKDGRKFKRYTKPGSKKFYLRDPAEKITRDALTYIRKQVGTIKI